MDANKSVLEYLAMSSEEALETFRISRLDRASRLRAKIAELYEQSVQAQMEACIAEWALDRRRSGDPSPRLKNASSAAEPPISDLSRDARVSAAHQLAATRGSSQLGQLALRLENSGRAEEQLAIDRPLEVTADTEPDSGDGSVPLAIPGKRSPGRPRLLAFPGREATAAEISPERRCQLAPPRAHHREGESTDAISSIARCSH